MPQANAQPAAQPEPLSLAFALCQQVFQGIPLNTAITDKLKQGMQGGPGGQQFFFEQSLLYGFYNWISTQLQEGKDPFYYDTTTDGGYPMYYIGTELTDPTGQQQEVYIEIVPKLTKNVVDGTNTDPWQFTWNGGTYNVIGMATVSLIVNKTPAWEVAVPVGLSALIPVPYLAGIAWAQVLKPVMAAVKNAVEGCFEDAPGIGQGTVTVELDPIDEQEDPLDQPPVNIAPNRNLPIADPDDHDGPLPDPQMNRQFNGQAHGMASDLAVAEEEVPGAIVDGSSSALVSVAIGGGALVGVLALVALPFIMSAVAHNSFQYVSVYNLTPYNLTWGLPYLATGAISLAPTASGRTSVASLIPGTTTPPPESGDTTPLAQQASFTFQNSNDYKGIGYVMSFALTDPADNNRQVTSGLALFNVPLEGENSLCVKVGSATDAKTAQQFWNDNNATYKQDQFVAQNASVAVTATFDYLDGKHLAPNGQSAYTYNSLLVFALPG